jgi:TRAP-type mannitol/chloroaromatic compound transport system substrate-binding protein
MNAEWWGSLSKSDQMIIEACASQANDLSYSEYNANNGKYLAKLVNEHGVIVKEFGDEVYDAFGDASAEVFEETRAHSALAAEVHDSFAAARAEVGGWMKLSESAYYAQRNRVLGL